MIVEKNNPQAIQMITTSMLEGKASIIPCDTIYGLSALYLKGEKTLIDLKGRDASKHFLVLATANQARELCRDIPEEIENLWPCPLTTILTLKTGGTIGVRVPDDSFLQDLLSQIGSPIYSTSVNQSGKPSLLDFESIFSEFGDKVDLVVKGPDVQGTTASTIIDATKRPFTLIRQGQFDASFLLH